MNIYLEPSLEMKQETICQHWLTKKTSNLTLKIGRSLEETSRAIKNPIHYFAKGFPPLACNLPPPPFFSWKLTCSGYLRLPVMWYQICDCFSYKISIDKGRVENGKNFSCKLKIHFSSLLKSLIFTGFHHFCLFTQHTGTLQENFQHLNLTRYSIVQIWLSLSSKLPIKHFFS